MKEKNLEYREIWWLSVPFSKRWIAVTRVQEEVEKELHSHSYFLVISEIYLYDLSDNKQFSPSETRNFLGEEAARASLLQARRLFQPLCLAIGLLWKIMFWCQTFFATSYMRPCHNQKPFFVFAWWICDQLRLPPEINVNAPHSSALTWPDSYVAFCLSVQ